MQGQQSSMVDVAYASLKRDILRCRLRPGEVIVDTSLAADYGMSKTPIRQAVQLLEREGLVTIVPRRGTFVRGMDFTAVKDTYRLRALLEPEAAVLAAERASAADLDALDALSDRTVEDSLSKAERHAANRELHVGIAEVAGVPTLTRAIESLNEEIERLLNLRSELGTSYSAVNHGRLVTAIRGGDEPHIREVASSGIERSRKHVLGAMFGESLAPADGATALH